MPLALRRLCTLHVSTILFLLAVAVTLTRAGYSLADPGTGWHLVTGRYMLETGSLLRRDPFSWTVEGHPWINFAWLFEVIGAWLERVGGLPLFGTVCLLVYALIPSVLYRTSVRSGAHPFAAILVVPVAYVVLLSHAMARPHIVTYLFFALVVARLVDVFSGRRDPRSLWWFPLLAALWANLHGGFMAGLAAVATVAGATALHWAFVRDAKDRRDLGVCLALLVAMSLATLATPYGVSLHTQAVEHLGMASTGYYAEFRSPDFHGGSTAVMYFEVLMLALFIVVAVGHVRFAWFEIALAVGTLHWALVSQRNMNLFVIVATPLVARGITPLVEAYLPRLAQRWRAKAQEQDRLATWRWHIPLASAVLVFLAVRGSLPFPTTLDDLRLSSGAARFIADRPAQFARMFNTDDLGGSLIYRFWPGLRVFMDDRTFVYGEDFVVNDYLTVFLGRRGWDAVLDRWRVSSAIVATSAPCAELLRASPSWKLEYGDEKNLIFSRMTDP